LPYYITSDILLHLFAFEQYFDRVVIMVQREVADRLVAKPEGVNTVCCQRPHNSMRGSRKLFELPPTAFNPPPKVHSAVIRLNHGTQDAGAGSLCA